MEEAEETGLSDELDWGGSFKDTKLARGAIQSLEKENLKIKFGSR